MIPNAPKEYEMHQNKSSGSNGVNRERLLQKIPTRLCGTNFCINCSISARFAPNFLRQRNGPKYNQIVRNTPKHEFRVQWVDPGVSCSEFQHDFMAWTFALIAPFQPVLHRVSQGNKTVPNASKQYETNQNMSLGSNGVDLERSVWKIFKRLHGTNFYINCTISARFASSFNGQWNSPKSIQTVRHVPKYEFRFQWGESGAFVAKNSDTTSWHELLH